MLIASRKSCPGRDGRDDLVLLVTNPRLSLRYKVRTPNDVTHLTFAKKMVGAV